MILTVLLSGCIHTETLRPEELDDHQDNDIIVCTNDGSRVVMGAGDHAVIEHDSVAVLKGSGTITSDSSGSALKPFEGMIPLAEIVSAESRTKTPFYYTGPVLFIAFLSAYFLLYGNIHQ